MKKEEPNTYITIVGADNYVGIEALKPGTVLSLKKDKNNSYDDEAIMVTGQSEACYGFVANSVQTVARGTHSAGYIYNMISDNSKCELKFILNDSGIAILISSKQED